MHENVSKMYNMCYSVTVNFKIYNIIPNKKYLGIQYCNGHRLNEVPSKSIL